MATPHQLEADRTGDPAFIISYAEANELCAENGPLPAPPDGAIIILVDGAVLYGSIEANVWWSAPDHRARWFEEERLQGKRPIIQEE